MGRLTGLTGPVYLDANIFIYALEGYPDFQARITILLEAMDHQEIEALTSELTLAEVLVKPFREATSLGNAPTKRFCNHLST